ncbi:MAG: hypothetical protein IJZ94_01825 [Clostridia bacterium]|nr:hypothetical protein [Clostridia bacterium]
MRKIIEKTGIVFVIAMFLIVCSCFFAGSNFLYNGTLCESSFSVSAAEEDDNNSVVTSDTGSQDSTAQTENSADTEQNNGAAAGQNKSESAFFKWAIPITCILSLVLAVFLAIRKANKIYGKEWE